MQEASAVAQKKVLHESRYFTGGNLSERVGRVRGERLQRLKDTLNIGEHITRLDISANPKPGQLMCLSLGGINLAEFAPEGVAFRAYHQVGAGKLAQQPYETTSAHHYSYVKRAVGLVVSCAPDAKMVVPIQDTRIGGLIALHEIGHAVRDSQSSRRRSDLAMFRITQQVCDGIKPAEVQSWYQQAVDETPRMSRQWLGTDSLQHVFRSILKKQIESYLTVLRSDRIITGLVPPQEIPAILDRIAHEVLVSLHDPTSPEAASSAVVQALKVLKHFSTRARRASTIKEEYGAWAEAQRIQEKLRQRNPRIQLWDGDSASFSLLQANFLLSHLEVRIVDLEPLFDANTIKQLRRMSHPSKWIG